MVDTKLKKPKIAVYDSDAPVTLKQGQGHQMMRLGRPQAML